jgi:hypothetical protein
VIDPAGTTMGDLGASLYELVEQYAALGAHRAGTPADAATVAWLGDLLAARGLGVGHDPVPFARWVASSSLTVGGAEVPHLPLPYCWTGEVDTDDVHAASFDPRSGGFPDAVDEPLAEAVHRGCRAAVLATEHPQGSLVGINRHELAPHAANLPAVLVAGRDAERCRTGPWRLIMRAGLEPATTTNLLAHSGVPGRPLVLTTPLTGWFTCAGERGTGIAVLVHLVERLAHLPLLVVATGGHELGFLGAHHALATLDVDPVAVVHLGASIGVEATGSDGVRRPAGTRHAMTSFDQTAAGPLADALAPANLPLRCRPDRWIGEGQLWQATGLPVLSISGAGVDFHTPEDVPARVTSPATMATVAGAVAAAAAALVDLVTGPAR